MNTRRTAVFGFLAAAALTITGVASAAPLGNMVRVKIPFAFELGEKTMPAGVYVIGRGSTGNTMLITASASGDTNAFLTTPAGDPNRVRNPQLLFEKIGAGYRLAEIYLSDGAMGNSIAPTRRQALIAGNQPNREFVQLALVLR